MDLPNNISKEYMLQEIEKLDNEAIPKDSDYQYFDVILFLMVFDNSKPSISPYQNVTSCRLIS